MTGFLHQHGYELLRLTFEHLWLAGFSLMFAAAIAVPTGIWLTRHERWARPVIGVSLSSRKARSPCDSGVIRSRRRVSAGPGGAGGTPRRAMLRSGPARESVTCRRAEARREVG